MLFSRKKYFQITALDQSICRQSIEFDPILYKKPKNYILFNERKREICMKLCQICDDLNIEGKASLDRITKNYNLINHNEPLKKSSVFKYLRTSKY